MQRILTISAMPSLTTLLRAKKAVLAEMLAHGPGAGDSQAGPSIVQVAGMPSDALAMTLDELLDCLDGRIQKSEGFWELSKRTDPQSHEHPNAELELQILDLERQLDAAGVKHGTITLGRNP